MRKPLIYFILISLIFAFMPTEAVNAQTDSPSGEETPNAQLGKATGLIINQSPGGMVPETMDLMLHIWDQNNMAKGMLHGESLPDGSFQFLDVPIELNSIYAVMASFDDTMYYSEQILLESEDTVLEFNLPIFDATSDSSQVFSDQAHILFSFEQGGMRIWEVYILSNPGEYTVKDAVTLDDGSMATFKFSLPPGASNLSFETDNGERFVEFPGGYADTSPLVPGVGSSQVIASYILPYDDATTYNFNAPVDVHSLKFLVVDDPGITFDGENLISEGIQTMQNGTNFEVYTLNEVRANESVEVTIEGEPENSSVVIGENETGTSTGLSSSQEIGIGALGLGLALVIAGIWWWRKPIGEIEDAADDVLEDSDFRSLVVEIVSLDDDHKENKMDDEEYYHRREAMMTRGKALLTGKLSNPDHQGNEL